MITNSCETFYGLLSVQVLFDIMGKVISDSYFLGWNFLPQMHSEMFQIIQRHLRLYFSLVFWPKNLIKIFVLPGTIVQKLFGIISNKYALMKNCTNETLTS